MRVKSVVLATVALLACVLVFGWAAPAQAQASSFPDVSAKDGARDAIEYLAGSKIISGYKDGKFGPGNTLTRGQATKVLVLWRELALTSKGPSFTDLDDTYRSYVVTAAGQGWINGFPGGTFGPYRTLTRQQMATIMVRAMGWEAEAKKMSAATVDQALKAFSDEIEISKDARPYVAMAVQKGLFSGSGGCINPHDGITRAQFCLVVFRAELTLRSVVTQIRCSTDHPDKTRVVLDLSRKPDSVVTFLPVGGKLIVDYTGGAIGGVLTQGLSSAEAGSVSVKQQSYSPKTVRITLDLKRFQSYRVMSLPPADGAGHRIAIDVFRRTEGPSGDGAPLICVDPGHGGSDSGAVGVTGVKEKDVNLTMSLLLDQYLRDAGLRTIMTRKTDILPGWPAITESGPALHHRAKIANDARVNLFVSVHNNAAGDPNAQGTETFYWGTPEEYSEEGKALAEAIQRNLLKEIKSVDRKARTHWNNLVVLAKTDMPAALAEVGFLTNAAEEQKLIDPEYQKAAARGIANGVLEYLGWSTTVFTSE